MKSCKSCKAKFEPVRPLQSVCSPICGITLASTKRKAAQDRQHRKEIAEAKIRIKTLADWLKDAQTAFNAYIRERDRDLPCISCGTFSPNIQYCAGHYLTRGAHPELRFDELNVHKQCNRNCNLAKSGNQQQYRIGLLMRLGEEAVAYLEGPHEPKQYTIDDAKALIAEYRKKTKALKTTPVYPV